MLGWLLRVDEAHRFRFLARRATWLLPLFFLAGPCYAALNAAPALQVLAALPGRHARRALHLLRNRRRRGAEGPRRGRRAARGREPHLHHAALALGVAAFGRFNHPASAALLAVAAGIFVQGIGAAYGFDPLIQEAGCRLHLKGRGGRWRTASKLPIYRDAAWQCRHHIARPPRRPANSGNSEQVTVGPQ